MTSPNPELPKFFRVRQKFASRAIDDVPQAVEQSLRQANLAEKIGRGQSVAITAGSRGISNIADIIATVVRFVSQIGGSPFVVPAMGSHGGATGPGQAAMLASFGIDQQSMHCPIVSSMETVLVGTTDDGIDIHFDHACSQADHVIVVNRIKPHTRLAGTIESGLSKMMMIGLGKHRGAQTYHQAFPEYDYSLDRLLPKVIPQIVAKMPITLGLAIVEDALDQTSQIEAIEPRDFLSKEPELLEIARGRMPRLPFDRADLLIVDQIGKEISGMGMDTNVIGRKSSDRCAGPNEFPKIREIYVRSLTKKSAGNACGVGASEYCHRRVAQAIDNEITRINCVTSGHATAGALPISFDCDREVLQAVMSQVGRTPVSKVKWMRIQDTLHIAQLGCSEAFWQEAQARDDLEVISDPQPLEFDQAGDFFE